MTLNVVCIKWGIKYDPRYVNHLARAVRRHLTAPHRFVCLTEDPRGIDPAVETKPLTDDLPGWWNKVALFKPRVHDLEGTIMFFDLDMIIICNIDALANAPGEFLAVPSFQRDDEFASAFLRFEIGRHRRVWDLFEPRGGNVMREVYGDQNWINACCSLGSSNEYTRRVSELWPEVTPDRRLIGPLPRDWFPDYKGELREGPGRISRGAKVIVFHGEPMVHEVGWVHEFWAGKAAVE